MIEESRYQILEACRQGGVCFLSEDIAKDFAGLACRPLLFDNQLEYGFACREPEAALYQDFFRIAREVAQETD